MLRITKFVCIFAAAFLILYDLIPYVSEVRGDTISEVIAVWGMKFFTLPFALGALCGHFFLLRRDPPKPKAYVLLPLLATVIALDAIGSIYDVPALLTVKQHPFVMLSLGILAGTWLWPQDKSWLSRQ